MQSLSIKSTVDGTTFIGFYLKKKREGEGELYYPNGRIQYRGGFLSDKREGYGVFYWGKCDPMFNDFPRSITFYMSVLIVV